MSVDEHSRPGEIMFAQGSSEFPVLTKSNVFDQLVLFFFFTCLQDVWRAACRLWSMIKDAILGGCRYRWLRLMLLRDVQVDV